MQLAATSPVEVLLLMPPSRRCPAGVAWSQGAQGGMAGITVAFQWLQCWEVWAPIAMWGAPWCGASERSWQRMGGLGVCIRDTGVGVVMHVCFHCAAVHTAHACLQ